MLSARPTLMTPSGASRGGDGDGVNKGPQNMWARQSQVKRCHGLVGGAAPMPHRTCGLRRASSRSQDTLALRVGRDYASVVSLLTTSPWRQASLHTGSSLERDYMHRGAQRWPANIGFKQSRESNPTDILPLHVFGPRRRKAFRKPPACRVCVNASWWGPRRCGRPPGQFGRIERHCYTAILTREQISLAQGPKGVVGWLCTAP